MSATPVWVQTLLGFVFVLFTVVVALVAQAVLLAVLLIIAVSFVLHRKGWHGFTAGVLIGLGAYGLLVGLCVAAFAEGWGRESEATAWGVAAMLVFGGAAGAVLAWGRKRSGARNKSARRFENR